MSKFAVGQGDCIGTTRSIEQSKCVDSFLGIVNVGCVGVCAGCFVIFFVVRGLFDAVGAYSE